MHSLDVKLFILIILNHRSYAYTEDKLYSYKPELFHMDNFDRCMQLGDEALYCNVKYELQPLNPKNMSEMWIYIKNISSIETNYRHDHLRHSICVPLTCPEISRLDEGDEILKKEIEGCFNEKYRKHELKGHISELTCQKNFSKYPVDWLDIIVGVLFVSYLVFVIYSTFYEHIASYQTSEQYEKKMGTRIGKMMGVCSLVKNWDRLKTIKNTPEVEKLRAIQGIRFYNSALVLLSHTIITFLTFPVTNTKFVENVPKSPASIFFASGHLCMTTFHFLSAFFLSNDLFEYLQNKKGLSLNFGLMLFALRLFRLVPITAVLVLFHATWIRHSERGPFWERYLVTEYKSCRKNGWSNILFINNLINPQDMCLEPTWFSALSMQYFIFSLLFIWLLKKYEKHFWRIIGASVFLNIVYSFWQNYHYNFSSLLLFDAEKWYDFKSLFGMDQIRFQLRGFWANIAGTLIGIAYGYFYFKRRTDSNKGMIFNSKFRVFLWWIFCLSVGFGSVIVPGMVILLYSNEHDAFWSSVYVALSKPLFALCLAVLIHGFSEKIGWIAYKICCWSPTYVLGRLTFSVYLVQVYFLYLRQSMTRYPEYISEFVLIMQFFSDLVVMYFAATFLTLFFELPLSALQKIVFAPKARKINEKIDSSKNE